MTPEDKAAFYEGALLAITEQRWNGHDSFASIQAAAEAALTRTGVIK